VKVLSVKPGHDGSLAYVDSGRLVFCFEAEKDSFDRHADVSASVILQALERCPEAPDVVAIGGWHKVLPGHSGGFEAGYLGLELGELRPSRIFGRDTLTYSSSHERSHIIGGIAMSPFDPRQDIAVLVWEGVIGSIYRWRAGGRAIEAHPVLDQPGARYSALYALADPAFPGTGAFVPSVYAGKLMALAGLADGYPPAADSRQVVDTLLSRRSMYPFHKDLFGASPLHNAGLDNPELWRAARYLTDRMFAVFHRAACRLLPAGLPLVIVGGCGLNCEWNRAWRECGHFTEVFVPPCADDSGSAIGTAVDAEVAAGELPLLTWDVYAGAEFVHDCRPSDGWVDRQADPSALAEVIADGSVVAWVTGRCEIGPRALGHRSLLARATDPASRDTLNRMKGREWYRPIAPVCLADDLGRWFDHDDPDPYMLFFRRVTAPTVIPAVTHADGSARVQSVDGGPLADLLRAYRAGSGIGVLCNTSLNYNGKGFINRMSELTAYCERVGIYHAVVNGRWWQRARVESHPSPSEENGLSADAFALREGRVP